jgi:hypothetical protein
VTGTTALDHFINFHKVGGALYQQDLVGRNGTTTTTAWDTTGAQLYSLKQTVTAANGLLVTQTSPLASCERMWNKPGRCSVPSSATSSFASNTCCSARSSGWYACCRSRSP